MKDLDSFELWSDLIRDLLASPGIQRAGLLLHMYGGSLDTEEIRPKRVIVYAEDFPARLREIREDELLTAVLPVPGKPKK